MVMRRWWQRGLATASRETYAQPLMCPWRHPGAGSSSARLCARKAALRAATADLVRAVLAGWETVMPTVTSLACALPAATWAGLSSLAAIAAYQVCCLRREPCQRRLGGCAVDI